MIYETKLDDLIAMATLDTKDDSVSMFENLDDSHVVISPETDWKIEKMIKQKSAKAKSDSKVRKVLSRVAIVALVVLTVSFTAMMSIEAVRNAVWNAFAELKERYFTVQFTPTSEQNPPTYLQTVKTPAAIPKDAETEVLIDNRSVYMVHYKINETTEFLYKQLLINDEDTVRVGSRGATKETVYIGDSKGMLFTYDKIKEIKLIWSDGQYIYMISGSNLDRDTAISIAHSVK